MAERLEPVLVGSILVIPAIYEDKGRVVFPIDNEYFGSKYANPKIDEQGLDLKPGDSVELTFNLTQHTKRFVSIRRVGKSARAVSSPDVNTSLKGEQGFVAGVYFSSKQIEGFDAAHKIANQWGWSTVLLLGGSGYGKTSMSEAYAEYRGLKYLEINCPSVRDPEEWWGTRELRDGETIFDPSPLVETLYNGNCVVCLDEINRVEPWMHGTLYTLLSHGRTDIHGFEITVGTGTIITATMNIGVEYSGTFQHDAALFSRFRTKLEVKPLPVEIEVKLLVTRTGVDTATATKIVNVMKKLRDGKNDTRSTLDASTRTSLDVAMMIAVGMDPRDAFTSSLIVGAHPSEHKNINDAVKSDFGAIAGI